MSSLLVERGFDEWDHFFVCDENESSLFFFFFLTVWFEVLEHPHP